MAGKWVDFTEVKEKVPIRDALEHYGLLESLREKGDQLTGPCPIHKGSNERQFSVSTSKSAFQCFSGHCGAKGNVLDFVAAMEGGLSIRDAGLALQNWFSDRFAGSASGGEQARAPGREPAELMREETRENPPLSFELKLDPCHVYLHDRGLTPETIAHFGLGYCGRGSMKGRIAIPIHDPEGRLVAYAGRWVESDLPEGEGKYKLPGGFHKALTIYNLHRIPDEAKEVVLVEGFFSVHWLHQNGWPNTASLMGSTLSGEQRELLVRRFKGVRLCLDGDDAGREAAERIALELAGQTWVRIATCPEGLQPDRLPAHELTALLK